MTEHNWPKDNEHMWGRWWNATGNPKPTQYRTCMHEDCKEIEYREVPRG